MKAQEQIILDAEISGAPEWVHLVPLGEIKARDGRRFKLSNPERVLAAFEAGEIDLPIDYEHQNNRDESRLQGPVPAAGWIKELATRANGIWGRVEWTAKAAELLSNREYRFISPVLLITKETGEVNGLKGAGLVHTPALHLVALARQEEAEGASTFVRGVAKLLGLRPDADESDVMAALEEVLREPSAPDPTKYAPVQVLEELMRDRAISQESFRESRAEAKVEDAIQRGYLIPPMKGWALELCKTDESAFDTFLSMSLPAYAHLTKELLPNVPPSPRASEFTSEDETIVCTQLGIDPERLRS